MESLELNMREIALIDMALESMIYKLKRKRVSTENYKQLLSKLHLYIGRVETEEFILTENLK